MGEQKCDRNNCQREGEYKLYEILGLMATWNAEGFISDEVYSKAKVELLHDIKAVKDEESYAVWKLTQQEMNGF